MASESNVQASVVAKSMVRRFLPQPVAEVLKWIKRIALLLANCSYDFWRYVKFSSAVFRGDSEEKLRALITIHYHSIEKGLSLKNPRPGFGVSAIKTLLEHISLYVLRYGPAPHLSVPINALSAYVDYNRSKGSINESLERSVRELAATYRAALGEIPSGGGAVRRTREEILRAVEGVGADFLICVTAFETMRRRCAYRADRGGCTARPEGPCGVQSAVRSRLGSE